MNLSQADFANKIHVSASTLCRWEKGASVPTIDTLEDICRICDIHKRFFWGDGPEEIPITKTRVKMRKGIVIATATVVLLGLAFAFFPRYRIISVSDPHDDTYGKTIVFNVAPIFTFNHNSAQRYADRIKEKYLDNRDIDAIEIYFVESENAEASWTESYEAYIFLNKPQ